MEAELYEDLVDSCIPGNVVTISGVVKSINAEVHGGRYGKRAQSNSLYILYLSANAVENSAKVQSPSEWTAADCLIVNVSWTYRPRRRRTRPRT